MLNVLQMVLVASPEDCGATEVELAVRAAAL